MAGTLGFDFLAYHLVPGVEVAGPGWYARTLDLPHGSGTVRLELVDLPEAWRTPRQRGPPSARPGASARA